MVVLKLYAVTGKKVQYNTRYCTIKITTQGPWAIHKSFIVTDLVHIVE